jgi:hypothetical protein
VFRGIAGQTSAGTGQASTLGGGVMLDCAHVASACIAGSQPGNSTVPPFVQTGSVDSAQRRKASISDTQEGSWDDAVSHPAAHMEPAAASGQPARAILSHVAVHDAAT